MQKCLSLQIMKKLVFIMLSCCSMFVYSQNCEKAQKLIDKAFEYHQKNNLNKCVETLLTAMEKYPDCPDASNALGQVYCSNNDLEKACFYYEKSIAIAPNYDLNAYYHLGKMNKQLKEYGKAKKYFSYYIDNQKKERYKDRKKECEKELKNIDFIEYSLQNPVRFEPYNLGDNINDTNYQYLPTLTVDEQLYITQRENNKEVFYFCRKADTDKIMWNKKQKMPSPPNNEENQNVGAASISPDGQFMFFAICNAEGGFGSCDIYVSKREGENVWSKPKNLGANVNSNAWDSQPTIASDGRTLFFVSNREGGFGGSDIYYSYLKSDGTWTKAKNLGGKINTEGNEISPFIHPSNTTLYFASDGHIGMGGMDIYFTNIINGKFTEPKNMGYPINTDADETCLIVAPDGKNAIFASNNLENCRGNMDLYGFVLYQDNPTPVICMKGKVIFADNAKGKQAKFQIKDLKANKVVAETVSDKTNSSYLMTIPKNGDYALSVECDGYLFYSENFSLETNTSGKYYEKDIVLSPIKEGETVVLHNIFFKTDSFELLDASIPELETLLKLLNENKTIRIEIAGHTDNIGNEQYNKTLSENRANSVKQWLLNNGIEDSRIESKGYGKSKPIADNSTEEGRKQNRRTEFKIIR